jgi:hypothetical protein
MLVDVLDILDVVAVVDELVLVDTVEVLFIPELDEGITSSLVK